MTRELNKVHSPLVFKLLTPLIIGVVTAFYTSYLLSFYSVLISLFFLFVFSFRPFSSLFSVRFIFGFLTSIFFFLLGVFLVGQQTNRFHSAYFYSNSLKKSDVYQVKVVEMPEEKANSIKCFVNVLAVNGEKTIGKTLLYFEKNERAKGLKYGDILCLQTRFATVKPNGNPKEFDYSRYLRIHNVVHQAYVKNDSWEKVGNNGNGFLKWIYAVRFSLNELLVNAGLNETNLMVAKALILGEKESLDRETLRTYSSAGAMHVLAVSGLHVGIVMLIFSFILKPIKRLPKGSIIFVVLVVLGIWFYALITGMSSSVLRASVMFSFVIIGKTIERDNSVYQSIMVSAFILILIEPLVIFQVGFQLSYLAVLGIVFLQPKIYNLFYIRFFVFDKIWQITSVSLAAQLATFPLGLFYFHQFPNFFMLSNLIVIPLAFAILITGMVYFIVSWIPGISYLCFKVLDFLLTVLNKGVKWIEELPYSIYWGVSINWFEVFWLYAIIVLTTGAIILRKSKLVLASLSLGLLLIVFNVYERFALNNSNQLVIYNVNKSIAIDVFYGAENVFIADSALIADEDKLLFHVKHNWFYRSGNENAYKTIQYDATNSLINFGGEHLYFLNGDNTDSIPKVPYVYLQNSTYLKNEIIKEFKENKVMVILGAGVGYQLRKYLEQELLTEQIHVLKSEGAFMMGF